MRYSSRVHRRIAIGMFVLGMLFLGTSGVQFVVDGNSKGATGTVIGVVAVLVGIHNLMRSQRNETDE